MYGFAVPGESGCVIAASAYAIAVQDPIEPDEAVGAGVAAPGGVADPLVGAGTLVEPGVFVETGVLVGTGVFIGGGVLGQNGGHCGGIASATPPPIIAFSIATSGIGRFAAASAIVLPAGANAIAAGQTTGAEGGEDAGEGEGV